MALGTDLNTLTLTMQTAGSKPELTSVNPTANQEFPLTSQNLIELFFSRNITYTSSKLVCENASADIEGADLNGTYAFDIKTTLFGWLENDLIKQGDKFQLVLEGVCDANDASLLYGEDGKLVVEYTAPVMPMMLVSVDMPEIFQSYWLPDAEDGIVTMTFTKELAPGADLTLGWGNKYGENEYYTELIPAAIEGKTLTVDLRNKLRTPKTMLPTKDLSFDQILVIVDNIKDLDGNYCYTDAQGTIGSFSYFLEYKDISKTLNYTFIPADEASIANQEKVELWISDQTIIANYDGVNISYFANGATKNVSIAKADLETDVYENELSIFVPVTEEMKSAINVKISLNNPKFVDGIARKVEATFNIGTENIYTSDGVLITPIGLGETTTPVGTYLTTYYYYDAPEDGTLTIKGSSYVPFVYNDQDFTERNNNFTHSYIKGGQQRVGLVEAGKRYFIKAEPASSKTFSLSLLSASTPPSIEFLEPAEGSVFSVSGNGLVAIRFNKNIIYDNAYVSCEGQSEIVEGSKQSGTYAFNIRYIVYNWLKTGQVQPGDKFHFNMENVREEGNETCIYGIDGSVKIEFIVPNMPTLIETASVPSAFLSYWMPDAEDGVITLTFNNELQSGSGTCTLGWGNKEEEGEYYAESVPVVTEGKVATVDLRGKLRNMDTMLPYRQYDYGTMFVSIANLKDTDGNPPYTEGQGTVGSYKYSLTYDDITGTVNYAFTPESGAIKDVDNVNLWVANPDIIASYDGITVTYTIDGTEKTVNILNADLTINTEYNELDITIPLTDEMKQASKLTFSLLNATYTDGVAHEVSVKYNNDATGINGVIVDGNGTNGTYNVYTTDGRMVKNNVNKTELYNLPAGLYIMNGKKIVIASK